VFVEQTADINSSDVKTPFTTVLEQDSGFRDDAPPPSSVTSLDLPSLPNLRQRSKNSGTVPRIPISMSDMSSDPRLTSDSRYSLTDPFWATASPTPLSSDFSQLDTDGNSSDSYPVLSPTRLMQPRSAYSPVTAGPIQTHLRPLVPSRGGSFEPSPETTRFTDTLYTLDEPTHETRYHSNDLHVPTADEPRIENSTRREPQSKVNIRTLHRKLWFYFILYLQGAFIYLYTIYDNYMSTQNTVRIELSTSSPDSTPAPVQNTSSDSDSIPAPVQNT